MGNLSGPVLRRTYLDHAATTPMMPAAIEAMSRELSRVGNASSLHGSGRAARRVVEESREAIAASVGARPSEVVFTSGGTEADNLAVKGAFWAARVSDPSRNHLVSTTIEHHAVLDALGWLEAAEGAKVTCVPVTSAGEVEMAALAEAVTSATALVSVIWGNNEVGTLQPVAEVARVAAACGARSHSDAVQAVGHVEVDFGASGLDTLSFTAHKLGGPYGVGALLAKREVTLTSVLHGGGQEREIRSGTLDVAAVAGFAAAVTQAVAHRASEEQRLRALRSRLVTRVQAELPGTALNGVPGDQTLPGVVNLSFPGCESSSILMLLDAAGIDCSAGSACAAGVSRPSHVLTAMGFDEEQARSCVRFSLGHTTTEADVETLLAALPEAVARAQAAGSLTG